MSGEIVPRQSISVSPDEGMWIKVLESEGETDPLCQGMTMVEMSGSDFMGVSDVIVGLWVTWWIEGRIVKRLEIPREISD